MSSKNKDVVALGEILIDFTEVGKNDQGITLFAQNPGGAPGNVCVALNRLGSDSAFVGKVGTDMHGDYLRKVLDQEGVDTSNLISDDDYFTTLAFVTLEDGERKFSFARKPGADTQIRFEEIDPELIKNARIFHVGSLSLTDEPARDATNRAVKLARDNGVLVSYDPNYRASLWPSEEKAIEEMRSLLPLADIVKISDEEIELITDTKDLDEAVKRLHDQGVGLVVITLGANGALASNGKNKVIVEGFKSNVVDTTGAGDSFLAGILHQIVQRGVALDQLSEKDLEEAVRYANATAALTVQKLGAIPALPTDEQVSELIVQNS